MKVIFRRKTGKMGSKGRGEEEEDNGIFFGGKQVGGK